MRQVITYLRFSSKPQERGDSIRRQKGLFERWLKDNPDAKVVDEYSDEGASAYHGHHLKGDFGRMLQKIQDGKYLSGQTVLLVESETRLNRQKARNTENLVDLITGKGVDVICLESGKIYTSTNIDDLDTSIQLKIAAHIAHQQSKEKSIKVSAAWEHRAQLALEGKQQLTKNVPGWIDPDTRKLNEHSSTVVTIFDLLLSGESLHNIARYLQANNIKSFSRREKANGFSVHSVRTILRSESTVGTLAASKRNDRPAIPNYYEPAIDVATFNKAQEILSKIVLAERQPVTIQLLSTYLRESFAVNAVPQCIPQVSRQPIKESTVVTMSLMDVAMFLLLNVNPLINGCLITSLASLRGLMVTTPINEKLRLSIKFRWSPAS